MPRLPGESGPERALHALIRFRGPAVQADGTPTYRTYSFGDLILSEDDLQNGRPPRVDPAVFKDAIVFVGVTAAGLHDVFVTPLGTTGKIPGAQIHATVMDQLLTHTVLVKAPTSVVTILAAALALAVAFLTVLLPMRWGALSTLALAGVARRRLRRDLPRRHVAAARARARRHGHRVGRRPRLAVFRRGPGQAAGDAALLPLRLEGRLRSGARQPGAGRARRAAPHDVRALLGHARLHRA